MKLKWLLPVSLAEGHVWPTATRLLVVASCRRLRRQRHLLRRLIRGRLPWILSPPLPPPRRASDWTLLSANKKVRTRCRTPPHERFLVFKWYLRMQLTLDATRRTSNGASRLVQARPTWSAKTPRAPSQRRRGASVYGHTIYIRPCVTAMTPPPSTPSRLLLRYFFVVVNLH